MKLMTMLLTLAVGSTSLCRAIDERQLFSSLPNPFVEKVKQSKPATMRVLVEEEQEGALIEVRGPYIVSDPLTGLEISQGALNKRFFLYPHKDGLKWGEHFLGLYQIRIAPTDAETTLFVNGIQYKGCIEAYYTGEKVNIINEVDMENYLKSTLSFEFSEPLHDEVLSSLAIVARTSAYYTAMHHKDTLWHVKGKDVNYTGYGLTLQHLALERAIEATRYLVMIYEGEPFASTWTTNSGGTTAHYQTIFRKTANTPNPVKCPYAQRDREAFHWSFVLDKNVLAQIVHAQKVTGIELYFDQESQKSYGMRVRDGIHYKDIDFFSLQKAIGKDKLRSNDFTISVNQDKVVFNGYGEGCGVGLCLYSAKLMAQHGESTPKILSAFFPSTQLKSIKFLEQVNSLAKKDSLKN